MSARGGRQMLPFWPWFGWLLVAAAVAFGVLAWALTSLRRWAEWHHGFLGVIVLLLGAGWWAVGWHRVGLGVALVGFALLADDAQSHARQAVDPTFPRSGARGYRDAAYSPLHRLAKRWHWI